MIILSDTINHEYSRRKDETNLKKIFAELFAGVGGFHIGLDRLHSGWKCDYANQYEPARKRQYAYQCYQKHYGPSKSISNLDINKVNKDNIPNMTLLVGGFPCQDYSVAHTHAKGIKGKRGVLWWQVRDTLLAKHPPFVLLENVNRLLSSPGNKQRGRDFGIILYTLNQLGYNVQWRMINSAWYGFPQRRRRVYIFAYRRNTNYAKKLSNHSLKSDILKYSVYHKALPIKRDIDREHITTLHGYKDMVDFSNHFKFHFEITGIMTNGKIYTCRYHPNYWGKKETLGDIMLPSVSNPKLFLSPIKIKKFKYLRGAKHIPRQAKDGHKYVFSEGGMSFPDAWNKPSRTILTSEHCTNRTTHVVKDKATGKLRLLAPIECERLQGFPDNWTKGMPNSSRYFMMGNALVCGMITKIGKGIDTIIKNEK